MRVVLVFLSIALVVSLLMICSGVVIGSLLRLVFPSVDRGMSILIGLIACIAAVYFLKAIFEGPLIVRAPEFDDEDDDPVDSPEVVRPPAWIVPPTGRPAGKPRRRRR